MDRQLRLQTLWVFCQKRLQVLGSLGFLGLPESPTQRLPESHAAWSRGRNANQKRKPRLGKGRKRITEKGLSKMLRQVRKKAESPDPFIEAYFLGRHGPGFSAKEIRLFWHSIHLTYNTHIYIYICIKFIPKIHGIYLHSAWGLQGGRGSAPGHEKTVSWWAWAA